MGRVKKSGSVVIASVRAFLLRWRIPASRTKNTNMTSTQPRAQQPAVSASSRRRDSSTVLVAGATGYIGRHTVRALHEAGYKVRALARNTRKLEPVADACDDVFVGEATRMESLAGLCDGVDAVVSSLGVRTLRSRPTPEQVDLHANLNVLHQAQSAGVQQFVFVGVLNGDRLMSSTPILRPREQFVGELINSGLTWTALRPNGSFNDMREIFRLAERGWSVTLGDGTQRINPVHPADIGQMVVQSLTDTSLHNAQFGFGGPDTYSHREIADLAADILGKPIRSVRVPAWPLDVLGTALYPVNRNAAGFLRFFRQVMSTDMIGAQIGTHRLVDFFRELRLADAAKAN